MKETLPGKPYNAQYGINLQSVIPMRRGPLEQSEMVSQLLFGEYYKIEHTHDKWLKITTRFDNYAGWIDRKLFHEISQNEYLQYDFVTIPVLAAKIAEIGLPDFTSLIIPAGSSLPGYDESRKTMMITGKVYPVRPLLGETMRTRQETVMETSLRFLNAPYLWGGRSVFGLDCSGFVQTVYKIHGIELPRDTSQQSKTGTIVKNLEEALPGDVAFFVSEEGNINHTGIVCQKGEIIHCSGRVRIDGLDSKGIFDQTAGIHTHRLKVVRRIAE